mgnify:CR=1 FL=1
MQKTTNIFLMTEYIDIEEVVLFCQHWATELYAHSCANGWSFSDDEYEDIADITNKKIVKLNHKMADQLCDFVINPPEKILASSVKSRLEAVECEIVFLMGLISAEDSTDLSVSVEDINNLKKPSSMKKRLQYRVEETLSRVEKYSTPSPVSKPRSKI